MTTLYRPVLIESVEQAEALPESAILISFRLDGRIDEAARVKDLVFLDWEALGGHPVTALVPIEAEEEMRHAIIRDSKPTGEQPETRLVTPWKES